MGGPDLNDGVRQMGACTLANHKAGKGQAIAQANHVSANCKVCDGICPSDGIAAIPGAKHKGINASTASQSI